MLKENKGKLAYITPNSFLRNTSQKRFRNYLVKRHLLSAIYDFKDSKVFDADTYTCICVIDKDISRTFANTIEYREYNMYQMVLQNTISYDYFRRYTQGEAWHLGSEDDIIFLIQNERRPIKIKSIATVQNGIATNRDSVYVGTAWLDKECTIPYTGKHTDEIQSVWFNSQEIESAILHRCVKESKYNGIMLNKYILFPYHNNTKTPLIKNRDSTIIDTKYVPYTEQEMQTRFPKAYKYLLSHYEDLITRNMEENADWFFWGRSQGLANSGYKKLVFKHVISKDTNNINVHVVDEDVIVYSGMYVTIDPVPFIRTERDIGIFDDTMYDKTINEIQNTLSSPDFKRYCLLVGKDMQGGYVSISSPMMKNYGTSLMQFPTLSVHIPPNNLPQGAPA